MCICGDHVKSKTSTAIRFYSVFKLWNSFRHLLYELIDFTVIHIYLHLTQWGKFSCGQITYIKFSFHHLLTPYTLPRRLLKIQGNIKPWVMCLFNQIQNVYISFTKYSISRRLKMSSLSFLLTFSKMVISDSFQWKNIFYFMKYE